MRLNLFSTPKNSPQIWLVIYNISRVTATFYQTFNFCKFVPTLSFTGMPLTDNPDIEGGSIAMNLFHTKMIEREAKRLADGMRANGLLVTKDDYKEILADLIGISQNEVQAGRSPLEWFNRGHSI